MESNNKMKNRKKRKIKKLKNELKKRIRNYNNKLFDINKKH